MFFLISCLLVLEGFIDFSNAQGKIIGGPELQIERFPYQVSLRYNGNHHCGGSIVKNNWILTAAHCVSGHLTQSIQIRAGSRDAESGGQLLQVARVVIHPRYSASNSKDFDIALLELSTNLLLGVAVRPITLPPHEPKPGAIMWITGYGVVTSGGPPSRYLRGVEVPIIDREDCRNVYGYWAISTTMLCAQTNSNDFCQGDTGGPLASDNQYGIASWSSGCATPGRPSVFTNVAYFTDFIQQHIGV